MKKSINQILAKPIYLLTWLILLTFLLRLIAVYFVKDVRIDNEWNILLENLVQYKSYSFFFSDPKIPSVYLPPAYPFFLYLVKVTTLFEGNSYIYSIIFIQIIFSTFSVYLFYKINQNFFSDKLSLFNATIFSVVPLNIYACGQISSINIQILFSLLFINFFFLILRKQNNKNIFFFSLITGLLILTRGEFFLIFIFIIFFSFFKKKIKLINLFKISMIIFLVISPYLARNYIHFNQILIVKSFGYNLWKGNNELSTVEGYENLENIEFAPLKEKIFNLEKNKYYEINRDNIFLKEAISNLKVNSLKYLALFSKKFFSYYFINLNSNYLNYYNFFHIFPIALISILSFPGLIIFYKSKRFENRCLGLYLFSNLIIFSIFFILPRYKMVILPIQIILMAYFVKYLLNKFNISKIK